MAEDTGIGLFTKILLAAPVVVATAVVGAMLWWVASSGGPEDVNLQSALAHLEDSTAASTSDAGTVSGSEDTTGQSAGTGGTPSGSDEGSGDAAGPADGSTGDADTSNVRAESENRELVDMTGVWNLDTSIGDYDYEKATGSFVGFRVNEVLTLGEATAVGRTGEVSGTITIVDNILTSAEVIVEMNTIATDRPIRDRKMHLSLKTERFPTSTFKLVDPAPLPAEAAAGGEFTLQINGDLTIAGIVSKAVFNLRAQLKNDVIVVVGSSDVAFADHNIQTPTAPIVISVEDYGIIEFQLLFTR